MKRLVPRSLIQGANDLLTKLEEASKTVTIAEKNVQRLSDTLNSRNAQLRSMRDSGESVFKPSVYDDLLEVANSVYEDLQQAREVLSEAEVIKSLLEEDLSRSFICIDTLPVREYFEPEF